MNLCLINPSTSKRPEIYGLVRHLPKDYNITILHPSKNFRHINNVFLAENINIKYIPAVDVYLSNSLINFPSLRTLAQILLSLIKSNMCDLIHVCDYEYLTSLMPIFIKHRLPLPTIIVNDALIGVDYCFGVLWLDVLAKMYMHSLGMKILNSYDNIVFIYSELARRAIELGLPREKVKVIYNGIDIIDSTQKRKSCFDDVKRKYCIGNEKVILYVGRLVKVKRVDFILKIVKDLTMENLDVVGLIVGNGPLKSNLERKTRALGLADRIKFTGHVSEQEKYEIYQISDLFILPSISEGLPTVLLEAASLGLPIVASNTNGIPDIVDHNKTGFLANKWNYNDYLKYARNILTDEKLAKKIGENARKHVVKNFSWSTISEKYQRLYKDMLNA